MGALHCAHQERGNPVNGAVRAPKALNDTPKLTSCHMCRGSRQQLEGAGQHQPGESLRLHCSSQLCRKAVAGHQGAANSKSLRVVPHFPHAIRVTYLCQIIKRGTEVLLNNQLRRAAGSQVSCQRRPRARRSGEAMQGLRRTISHGLFNCLRPSCNRSNRPPSCKPKLHALQGPAAAAAASVLQPKCLRPLSPLPCCSI